MDVRGGSLPGSSYILYLGACGINRVNNCPFIVRFYARPTARMLGRLLVLPYRCSLV